MTPERWTQIEEMFHRAAECAPEQRTALLNEACGDDSELRREVEALLSCDGTAGDSVQAAVLSELSAVAFPLTGETISHYRILDGLGGGGMGLVYRAEDIKLGRRVALKFLPEESAKDPATLGRFEREARLVSALEHPNICPVYEFGEHEGQPFLVMPLLDGQTLRELISAAGPEKAPLEVRTLLDLAIHIVDGLDAAHRQGIIHRDVKPANIFVTTQGQIKILDFGLAKLAHVVSLTEDDSERDPGGDGGVEGAPRESGPVATPDPFVSRSGVAMGTAGYMSPEQIRGEKLDARTDLFSFGLVLYEMATGKRAFAGDAGPALQEAILKQVPTLAREVNPELPAKLEEVMSKALEKDRAVRYQSASEMHTDLETLKRGMEPRHRAWWREMAAAGVVVLFIAGATFWLAKRQSAFKNSRPNLEKFQVTKLTDSGNVELAAISGDGRYVCYSRRDRGVSGLWLYQVATHSEVQVLPADAIGFDGLTFSPDGNHIYYVQADKNDPGFKYLYVIPVLGGSSRLLIKDIDSPVSFSPDGQRFVYTRGIPPRNSTDVRIANSDGSGDRLLAKIENTFPGFQPGATWSPDGRTVTVSLRNAGRHSYILDTVSVADGSVRELYSSSRGIGRPLWLPEGDTLLLVMNDQNERGQLWTISYPNAQVRRITNDLTDYDTRADLTRDAKTMVVIANHPTSNVWVAPAADLSQAQQITSAALPLFRVAEAPDGHLLATSMDGKLWSLQADGSQRTPFTDLLVTDFQGDPAPCGRLIVFVSGRAGTTELVRVTANGADAAQLVRGNLNSFVCTPDGKYVFYDDLHKISRIPVEGGVSVEIAQVLGENIGGRLSISPDGKFLAYPYRESTPAPTTKLAIISAEGGSPTKVLSAPGIVLGLLWSRDGKSLQYSFSQNGASNIWEQPLTGGEPRHLTKFSSGVIFDFHWSLDGNRLLLARGEVSSDAALLSNLR